MTVTSTNPYPSLPRPLLPPHPSPPPLSSHGSSQGKRKICQHKKNEMNAQLVFFLHKIITHCASNTGKPRKITPKKSAPSTLCPSNASFEDYKRYFGLFSEPLRFVVGTGRYSHKSTKIDARKHYRPGYHSFKDIPAFWRDMRHSTAIFRDSENCWE